MKKSTFTELNEVIYEQTLPSGLRVFYCPKPNFHKTFVTLSIEFGAIHRYIADHTTIPKGVAHFLEHKLFEYKKQDISKQFTKQQANVNAYTQHNRTTVLFSCTNHLIKNIDLLLDITLNAEFSEEFIQKEQDIIIQEINMYQDDPSSVAYMELLRGLFHVHPVRHDILGTKESVQLINYDILKRTHKQFYHPANMMLFIAGDMDLETLQTHLKEKTLTDLTFMPVYQPPIVEPQHVKTKRKVIVHQIDVPQVLLGYKLSGVKKSDIMRQELLYSMLFDLIIGQSTERYALLLTDGLINDSFGFDVTLEEEYAYLTIGSETMQPSKLEDELINLFHDIPSIPIEKEDFLRTKKQIVGGFIHALNSLEYIANQFTKYYFQGISLFSVLDVAKTITYEDVLHLKEQFHRENAISIVLLTPQKEKR